MSTPPLRPALAALAAYKAGKPPAGGPTAYKLSSNENPYPPLRSVVDKVTLAAGSVNRYPDMGMAALLEAVAANLGVDVARIACATGSVAVLYHLLQAACGEGDEVVYAWRSFEAYPIAVGLTGATDVRVPLTADARHDLAAMRAAVTDATRVVIVCTPNNPTGPSLGHRELVEFVDALPPSVIVVVDEAYREFDTGPDKVDGLKLAADRENVVVLRTFSKAYGLAGLRVGYGVAPPRLAEAIRKCALPFGVSHVAQVAAVASLEPAAEIELLERVDALVAERERVAVALREQGWTLPDAQGNFVWFPLGDLAADFAARCDEQGVSVRPFPGEGVRVTIGESEANDVVLRVAAQILADSRVDT